MRIKRLDISGFKSFCDHTRILFDHALTAVVGPNGCGKSNIVDAIRWGLGELSAKNLRGRGMEDVIFNGSESRGPQSVAEVTITFDNTDGLSHPAYADYPEVAVTRRLFRGETADSEYLINKTPCRLKDITDLFLGTGGGARAYSIIEQGRIGLIVSSRSEDRRAMIEEAAGITRFKKARTVAFRKMELTRQNLLRITDVIGEMEKNLANLKRQARKAERHREYAGEQRDLELYLASHRYLELRAAAMVAGAALAEAEGAARDGSDALGLREATVEGLRVEETAARAALDEDKARAFEVNQKIQVLESELRHLGETLARIRREEAAMSDSEADLRRKVAGLEDERRTLAERLGALTADAQATAARRDEVERSAAVARTRLAELGSSYDAERDALSRARARAAAAQSAFDNLHLRIEEAESRLAAMREERGQFDARLAGLEGQARELDDRARADAAALEEARRTVAEEAAAYEELRRQLDVCDAERRAARDDVAAVKSRLASLEEVHRGLQRHDQAVREAVAALKGDGSPAFIGLLVDFVDCPAEYEVALAAVLGDRLEGLVAEDTAQGLALLEWIKARDLGRVTALAMRSLPAAEPVAIADPAIAVRLADVLDAPPEVEPLLRRMLGNAHVVGTSADALRLWEATAGRATFVTRDGQLIDDRGAMRGGRPGSAGADLLGQKREIRQLAGESGRLEARHGALDAQFDALKASAIAHRDAAERAQARVNELELQLAGTRKDLDRATEDFAAARQRRDAIEREVAVQEEQLRETRADRDQAAAQMLDSRGEIEALERSLAEHSAQIDACRAEADRLAGAVTEARIRQAQFDQQRSSAVERSAQIAAQAEELDDGLRRLARRRLAGAEECGRAAGTAVRDREALAALLDEAERTGAAVEACTRGLEEAAARTQEAEALLRDERRDAEARKERAAALRMDEKQAEMDVAYLLDSVAERYDIDLLRVLGDHHMRPIPGEEVRRRIEELRGLIERMGPINPGAIQECEETGRRYEEKVTQKADVERALADLEAAIQRMDRDSKRMFKETFESVNARFQEIFPRLFKGGQARLALTDPDDLLGTGVDIIAQPPGKKIGNIELMSGGEKALTAVSLLFAIFLHRPSPFCLLDEVDAPLDEANVSRFVEMVRELTERTQFIVITHSKVTMEGSDALYGVTMQEPGVSKLVSVRLVHAVPAAATA